MWSRQKEQSLYKVEILHTQTIAIKDDIIIKRRTLLPHQ
jgi:hypothetical protein